MESNKKIKSNLKYGILLLLLILTFITYKQVLNNGYVWDDNIFFQERYNIKNGILNWKTISQTVLPNASYFRPLVFLTYIIEIKIFGLNPFYMHLNNLLIHLINIILAYRLAFIFLKNSEDRSHIIPLIIASIFALHPIQVEAITWIAGRFDLLSTTFSFLTLIILTDNNNNKIQIIFGSVFFFLALLCKETAILLIPIYLIIILFKDKNSDINDIKFKLKNKFQIIISLAITVLIYFTLRSISLDHTLIQSNEFNSVTNNIFNRIWYGFYIITEYILILLNPFSDIGPVHPQVKNLTNSIIWYIYPIISISLLLLSSFILVKKNEISSKFFIVFVIASILFTQIFVSIFLAQNTIADRYMYFPLFFFFLALITISYKILKTKTILLILSVYLLFSIFTIKTTLPMWQNNYTLWFWQYSKYPESFAKQEYFHELVKSNQLSLLEKEFKKLHIKKDPLKNTNSNGDFDLMINQLYGEYLIRTNDPEAVAFLIELVNTFPPEVIKGNNVKNIIFKRAYISCLIQLSQAFYYINNDYNNAIKTLKLAKNIGNDQYDVVEWEKKLNNPD